MNLSIEDSGALAATTRRSDASPRARLSLSSRSARPAAASRELHELPPSHDHQAGLVQGSPPASTGRLSEGSSTGHRNQRSNSM